MFASVVDYKRSFVVHYQRSFVFVVVCRVDGGDDDDDDDDDDGGGGGVSNGSFFETSISIRFPLRVSFYANDTLSRAQACWEASFARTNEAFLFQRSFEASEARFDHICLERESERERAKVVYILLFDRLLL